MWFGIGQTPGSPAAKTLFTISGIRAYSILERENGLHILEIPKEGSSFRRVVVNVRVVPQPVNPPGTGVGMAGLAETQKSENKRLRIVRRYRELPSPLVRDDVRKWRTGRFEDVLEGNFDLMQGIG
jgi:ATP-dependent Clp protease ATP-binding subunit ClpC